MKPEDVAREKIRLQEKTAELLKIGSDMKAERAAAKAAESAAASEFDD